MCVALLVVGVLATAAWVLLGSRLLVVRHVQVTGVKILPRDRVVTTARVPLGTPMVRMDTDVVRDRVERLPEVESARVERRWPATVRIVVRERVPVVVVERARKYYEMDRYGVIVVTTSRRPSGLPALVVANPSATDPATAAALKVRGDLPVRFARRLAQIEASSAESVTLRFKAGTTVVWGAAERSEEKVRLIDALLATPEGRAARTVDVSSPEVVTTR
ncbi:FtsQ-type POTRA domain-containing protein [Actinomadura sp. HBU206391]|nr:FtsQ-type POTRA domain-containing protein [Actinomadura sp. HBU206391]